MLSNGIPIKIYHSLITPNIIQPRCIQSKTKFRLKDIHGKESPLFQNATKRKATNCPRSQHPNLNKFSFNRKILLAFCPKDIKHFIRCNVILTNGLVTINEKTSIIGKILFRIESMEVNERLNPSIKRHPQEQKRNNLTSQHPTQKYLHQ